MYFHSDIRFGLGKDSRARRREKIGRGHEQVDAFCWIDETMYKVDSGIKELLETMWDMKIMTRFSCEGSHVIEDDNFSTKRFKRAYVMMYRTYESQKFLMDLVVNYPSLQYNAVDRESQWAIDYSSYEGIDRITIHFPKKEIPNLIEFLNEEK